MEKYVVHLGKVKLDYDQQEVEAKRILEDGGASPASDYTLEATDGERGKVIEKFVGDQLVDLHVYKHFRAVPNGGGRADGK